MLDGLGDAELLVPEARELGGFGFEIDGELYNVDTLKFFEVLIALERGAVLAEPARPGRAQARVGDRRRLGRLRPPVQDRSFPDITYVIIDLPELFLFSAHVPA